MSYSILDSSCWIEYFNGTPLGQRFAVLIEEMDGLLVPSVCVTEVYGHALRHRGADDALVVLGGLVLFPIVDLDPNIAKLAAELSVEHGLPLADSIIYATARSHDATLLTLDSDFAGLPGVELVSGDALD